MLKANFNVIASIVVVEKIILVPKKVFSVILLLSFSILIEAKRNKKKKADECLKFE